MNHRVVAAIALSVTVSACCVGGIALTFARGGVTTPTSSVALIYACPEPVAAEDAARIEGRLGELRAWGRAEVLDPTHVRVRVGADQSSRDLAAAITRTRALGLMPVDEEAMRALAASPLPEGIAMEPAGASLVTFTAPDRATFAPLRTLVPEGDRLVLTCGGEQPGCRGYVVLPAVLGNADLAQVDEGEDEMSQSATVGLTLTASGAQRFEALTARIVGSRVAVVLDDHAIFVPRVQDRIAGGRVMITLGVGSELPEASALAATLRGGRLSCSEWSLESESLVPE